MLAREVAVKLDHSCGWKRKSLFKLPRQKGRESLASYKASRWLPGRRHISQISLEFQSVGREFVGGKNPGALVCVTVIC